MCKLHGALLDPAPVRSGRPRAAHDGDAETVGLLVSSVLWSLARLRSASQFVPALALAESPGSLQHSAPPQSVVTFLYHWAPVVASELSGWLALGVASQP